MCYTLKDRDFWLSELTKLGFGHVSVEIMNSWNSPAAAECFRGLLLNKRDDPRLGFPPLAYKAILKLYTIYAFMNESLDEWAGMFFVD